MEIRGDWRAVGWGNFGSGMNRFGVEMSWWKRRGGLDWETMGEGKWGELHRKLIYTLDLDLDLLLHLVFMLFYAIASYGVALRGVAWRGIGTLCAAATAAVVCAEWMRNFEFLVRKLGFGGEVRGGVVAGRAALV